MKKSDREIMEILEAFDTTNSAHSAAALAGVDPKTVRRYVAARDAGTPVTGPGRRERMIDPFVGKVEEWVDRSKGKIRADVVHQRLVGLGFTGTERTTRRAVAEAKRAWRAGRRRTYRPWITEPGLWLSSTGARARMCLQAVDVAVGLALVACGFVNSGEVPLPPQVGLPQTHDHQTATDDSLRSVRASPWAP